MATKRRAPAKGKAKRKAPAKRKYPSSTGKVKNVKADQTNWRVKLQQSRIKFDDDQKQVYLVELAKHGLKGRSARAAGVSNQTVRDHMENDEEFATNYEEALEEYRDLLADEVRRRGADGWLEPVYNKDGRVFEPLMDLDKGVVAYHNKNNEMAWFPSREAASEEGHDRVVMVPAFVRKFSDRMLELDVKRVDPSYRDKQTIDLNNTGGGVLVAPAGMTVEEAIVEGEKANAIAKKEREEALAKKGKAK